MASEESGGQLIEGITELVADNKLQVRDLIQNPGSFMRRRELAELLVHERLIRNLTSLPGSLIEIGIKFGNIVFFWNKLLEIYAPLDTTTKIFAFDSFEGYNPGSHDEHKAISKIMHHQARIFCDEKIFQDIIRVNEADSLMPDLKRVQVVSGKVERSLNPFLNKNKALRFKLIHLDVNLYEPTAVALRLLEPRVVIGGQVLVRSFGVEPWGGETVAVEEFLKENPSYVLSKDSRSRYPSAVLTKT